VVTGFVQAHRAAFDRIQPSFFEWTVALAFDYFRNEQVDIAIIETGLGGRLDSTNVITPEVALITNIGWDHVHFLGDTLEKIAAEKAGIIKPGVPVVIGEAEGQVVAKRGRRELFPGEALPVGGHQLVGRVARVRSFALMGKEAEPPAEHARVLPARGRRGSGGDGGGAGRLEGGEGHRAGATLALALRKA
jgi:hypothetical protein